MNDITDLVEVDQIGVCPLCSNGIVAGDDFTACTAHGFVVLAHEMCLVLEDEEDEEDDE